jgi:hypothetical protein
MYIRVQAMEYVSQFEGYAYLWLENRQMFLEEFLKTSCKMIPEQDQEEQEQEQERNEENSLNSEEHDGTGPPGIQQFREQVCKL